MRIEELAERAGVTTKTIRFYEDKGVVERPARRVNGYRDPDAVCHVINPRSCPCSAHDGTSIRSRAAARRP
jgi:MerR family regulatory protein